MRRCVAIIQPGGDKSMDELLCICQGDHGAELGDVSEMEEGRLAQVFNV